jgi:hypothetical protein
MLRDRSLFRILLKGGYRHPLQLIVWLEAFALIFIIFILWLDELLDLPHLLLGAPTTPANWQEAFLESCLVAFIGGLMIWSTHLLLKKIRHLEGVLPVCSSCKKIRNSQGEWIQIESYIASHSEAEFSHGLCPVCLKKLYPAYYDQIKDKLQ